MIHRIVMAMALLVGACGEDDPPPAPARPPVAPVVPVAAAPGATGAGKQLQPMLSIEDRVQCPSPTTERTCDPKLPSSCKADPKGPPKPPQYCLETTKGWFCGGCAERDTIRQTLKFPRDFVPETIRDPFVSYVVQRPGQENSTTTALPKDVTKRCADDARIRLGAYSFLDLKLVGVIKLGLQRKLLMMDPVNVGHVIARNECVGKERAYVKDIGEEPGMNGRGAFVIFEIPPDPTQSDARPPEERTIYLNPNARITMTQPPSDAPRPTDTPVVAPGSTPRQQDAGSAAPRGSAGAAGPADPPPPIVAPR